MVPPSTLPPPTVDDIWVRNDGASLTITGGASLTANGVMRVLGTGSTITHDGGSLSVNRALIGDSGSSNATYSLSGSAVLSVSNALSVADDTDSTATFSIEGSNASVSTKDYLAMNSGTQQFVFDSAGVSPINASGSIDLVGSDTSLVLDLTNLIIASNQTFTLIDGASGLTESESFGLVSYQGLSGHGSVGSANVRYDTDNHDVLLDVALIPEPGSLALLMIGLGGTALAARRRRAS